MQYKDLIQLESFDWRDFKEWAIEQGVDLSTCEEQWDEHSPTVTVGRIKIVLLKRDGTPCSVPRLTVD